MIFKLISPIQIRQYNLEEDCEYVVNDNSVELYQSVLALLNKERFQRNTGPEELSKGLMCWYNDASPEDPTVNGITGDIVKRTITFAFPTVEIINGEIMGVCYCNFESNNLTDEERVNFEPTVHQKLLDELTDYISGQYSDGWGEGLEQQYFECNEQDTFVSFWTFDKTWSIKVEGFDLPQESSVVELLKQVKEAFEAEENLELAHKLDKVIKALNS